MDGSHQHRHLGEVARICVQTGPRLMMPNSIMPRLLEIRTSARTKVRGSKVFGVGTKAASVVFFALAARAAVAQRIIFVDVNAVGLNDGTSWPDARVSLQDALATAASGDSVWVARGTYKPGSTRAATFQLRDGVMILGGFAGTEDPTTFNPAARDFVANVTTLDGNIGSPAATDNVFHVVTASGVGSTAVLDGFTIAGGFADGLTQSRQDLGGGMLSVDASPTIRNCTLRDNQSGTRGGAVHIDGGSPMFLNCRFVANRTTVTQAVNNLGGAIYANAPQGRSAQARFVNCLFVGNRAGVGNGGFGGAIYDDTQSLSTFVNCTLLHNKADTHGGAIFGGPALTNCIVWGNSDRDGMTRASQIRGAAVATFSAVQGGWAGLGNVADDPLFRDAFGADGLAGTADDDARLSPGSPCIDAGDNAALPPAATVDLNRASRIVDDPVTRDTGRPLGVAIVDMGAFEYQAQCGSAADCDNGFYCDGIEECVGGRCQAGIGPDCDDGIACTRDSCRETDQACVHEPDDSRCDNGVYCDGQETCDALAGCKPGIAIVCDDHVVCTIDACNEANRACAHIPDASLCDDGLYCNGGMICDALFGCQSGPPIICFDGIPCTVDRCDEAIRGCVFEPDDARCDDGFFCNGSESCTPGDCVAGVPPCEELALCDEEARHCLSVPLPCDEDAECDDDNPCTNDTCADGFCERSYNLANCDDGIGCTENDICHLGLCSGTMMADCGEIPSPPTPSPPAPIVNLDHDGDGVPDADDRCADTSAGASVDIFGCACAQRDGDADGSDDCTDRCPDDPNKSRPGVCGCGVADRDSDADDSPDCVDRCPTDSQKTVPGLCECGTADDDRDGDGTPDCVDGCPDDASKTSAGVCGCGLADADEDGDAIADCRDACPNTPIGTVIDETGCPVEPAPGDPLPDSVPSDADEDGIADDLDYCPDTPKGLAVDADGCPAGEIPVGQGVGQLPGGRSCGACGALGSLGFSLWPTVLLMLVFQRRRNPAP